MNSGILNAKKIHFFGVGGIGVSAITRFFIENGKSVSGSDISESPVTDSLAKLGVSIKIGQSIADIPKDADLVVYSAAIEVAEKRLFDEIKKLPIKSLSYAEVLGEISKNYRTIAVSGTHGKTTTTAMIAKILIDAGLSPTVVVGSLLSEGNTNFVAGKSDIFVVEADEYRRNFLTLTPSILVITNIDLEHLDYYKDLTDIQSAFSELVSKLPSDGALITDLSKKNVVRVAEGSRVMTLDYGSVEADKIKLSLPGTHNKENAAAALTVSGLLGVSEKQALKSLADFKGTARRFEYKGETPRGALVYDDYAHNPQKVRALIAGAREKFPGKKIIAVFQPHLFSRTKTLFDDFARSFEGVEKVYIAPIFPAREKFDSSISSTMLAEAVSKSSVGAEAPRDFAEIAAKVADADSKYVILIVGAGDIYKLADEITAN